MASKSLGTLTLDLVARTGGFVKGMDKSARESDKWKKKVKKDLSEAGKQFKDFSKVAAASFAVLAAVSIKNSIEQERVTKQLEAALKSTGGSAGLARDELLAMAAGLQTLTTYGDEAIIPAQALLLTFTKIGEDIFPAALESVLDVATAMGTDLKSAAVQVGKALNDPVLGMTALSRSGIQFTEDQKKVVNQMVATGNSAGAQAIILKELETQFGGSAKAARETFGGSLVSLKNTVGDLLEGGGGNLEGARLAVEDLNKALSDPRIKEAFSVITAGVLNVATAIAGALPALTGFTTWAAESLAALSGGIAGDDIIRLEQEAEKLEKILTKLQLEGYTQTDFFDRASSDLDEVNRKIEVYYDLLKSPPALTPVIAPSSAQTKDGGTGLPSEEEQKAAEAAAKAAEKARKAAAQAAVSAAKAIDDQVTAMERAVITWGMTSDEVALYGLTVGGASASQLQYAETLLSTVTALEAQQEAIKAAAEAQQEINVEAVSISDSLRTEEEAVMASYERRRQIILDNTQITGDAQGELLRRLGEQNSEDLLAINGTYWEKYLEAAEESLMSFEELSAGVIENLSGSFGDAFESMIFDAETLGEAVSGMAEGMLRSVVNAVGQMAAQWLALQAIQMITGKTAQASAATTMVANASAMSVAAGLNAFASTAAIPIVGPALAPGAALAATAITAPMAAAVGTLALSGMAHDGMDSIPKTGTWLLEKGERVTTAETSVKLDSVLSDIRQGQREGRGGGMNSSVVQNISVQGRVDRRTSAQMASDAARKQKQVQARFG